MDVGAIIASVTGVATLLVLIGGGFYWWGRLSSRVDGLSGEIQSVREEVKSVREEVKSVRDEVRSVRDEVRSGQQQFLAELRRTEQRILTVLANHSHVAPEAGRPVFWFPPGMEAPGPSAPDETPVEA